MTSEDLESMQQGSLFFLISIKYNIDQAEMFMKQIYTGITQAIRGRIGRFV